jgi:predicted CxxxxCH...CXXCH cytochrome family protein
MRITPRAAALGLAVVGAIAGCGVAREVPAGTDRCRICHGGDAGNAAPPRSVFGGTGTSDPHVGAHQAHLRGGALRGPIACAECHVVPSDIREHMDGDASPVFGPLARARSANPVFTRTTGKCAGTYCHGATLGAGGSLDAPVWNIVDGTQAACGTCHGNPPPLPHPQASSCTLCHPNTVLPDGTIDVAGGQHIDGTPDVSGGGGCGACHPVPPPSGAHRVHYGDASSPPLAEYGDLRIFEDYAPADGSAYAFGCGHCHPLDPARHGQGEVDLSPAGAPAGTLKARNAADAAYDATQQTCSGVYCHSNGKQGIVHVQVEPDVVVSVLPFRTTPPWTSSSSLDCAGCHDDPPRYESGGAGAADANTHLQLASDGWETGHFAGLPGPWHSSKHGGDTWGDPQKASPITCQTCHYETADPAATGPSGFYWLNTTGNYVIPGGQLGYDCDSCHQPGHAEAPTGAGGVLPLRHVNGRADVVFDPRLTLPPYAALPAFPFTPSRPIFATDAALGTLGPDASLDPDPIPTAPPGGWPYAAATLSMHLESARYDPPTKTCSNVSCHLAQTTVEWGGPTGFAACGSCHGF